MPETNTPKESVTLTLPLIEVKSAEERFEEIASLSQKFVEQIPVIILPSDTQLPLAINFNDITRFDFHLAEYLLEYPKDTLTALKNAMNDRLMHFNPITRLGISHLPESSTYSPSTIQASELGKLVQIRGTIKQKTDKMGRIVMKVYDCPVCLHKYHQPQEPYEKPNPPTRCPKCKTSNSQIKVKFNQSESQFVTSQTILIEENYDTNIATIPAKMSVLLEGDLCSPLLDKDFGLGEQVEVVGFVNVFQTHSQKGSAVYTFYIDAIHIRPTEDKTIKTTFTPEEIKNFQKFAAMPMEDRIEFVGESIYGLKEIKMSLLLACVRGNPKKFSDGTERGGELNILVMGDTGTGKTLLGKCVLQLANRSRYCSGSGTTGVGLTACVVKDQFGNWSLEAGAMVLATNSIIVIDEFEKIGEEERTKLHEAMSVGHISINKAGIKATLPSKTSVFALANPPETARFHDNTDYAHQLKMPPTLLNRFDLIFALRDVVSDDDINKIGWVLNTTNPAYAKSVMKHHTMHEKEEFKAYLNYARTLRPKRLPEVDAEIQNFYIRLRKGNDETNSPVPISLRQGDTAIKISEAFAKLRLAEVVAIEDAKNALELIESYLIRLGLNTNGAIDVGKVGFESNSPKWKKENTILSYIPYGKVIEVMDLKEIIVTQGGLNELEFERYIEAMKKEGVIFSPRDNLLQRL